MKKKYLWITLILVVLCTGCFLDPYTNSKYGESVIDSWYTYKNGDDNLGKTRKKVENISTIEKRNCDYVTKYKSNYIFKCIIEYKEIGEVAIPFANNKTLSVYALFTPLSNNTFTYKVYNSKSENKIWEKDSLLK